MVLKQLAKQYRKQRCSDDGFTLIEVLIAIFVLSIGVLAVGMMQISSINGNKIAFNISEASFLAESELERLLSIPFGDVTDDNGDGSGGLDNNTVGTADDNTTSIDGRYTILRNVADDFPENNTKTIKIIVIWDFKGNSKSLSISSIKAS
jgi:type IV pilus assembly protein PilV